MTRTNTNLTNAFRPVRGANRISIVPAVHLPDHRDEGALSPEIAEPTDQRKGSKLDERETTVLTMFAFGVEALLQLRGLIK